MTTKRGKTPRCKWCDEWVDKSLNDFVKGSAGYYHTQCHEAFELNKYYKKQLDEYIMQLYNISYPTGWMNKQIKEYKEKRSYTYAGMLLTLQYIYEIDQVNVLDASVSGLGLIPYYYEKAKKHYTTMQDVSESVRDAEINNESEIIYLKPIESKRNKKLIDMNSLLQGE